MQTLLSALLINHDDTSRATIAALLARCRRPVKLRATAASIGEGMSYLESAPPPEIIILEVYSMVQGIRDVSAILAITPRTTIVVTSAENQPDWILPLIRAGAGEYLTTPIKLEELEAAVTRVALRFEQHQGRESKRGKVITVYNPSGGIGTTTIAVNLAATLAAKGEKTAIVDFNPFSNDVSGFLNLTPESTLSGIQESGGEIDATLLLSLMTEHSSGMQLLSGSNEIDGSVRIAPVRIRELLTLMQGLFATTVIDSGGTLSLRNLETFSGSDVILYPILLTLPVLNNAKRYLKGLKERGFGPDRVKVVVTRYLPRDDISIDDAEKILGREIFHTIPNAYGEIRESISKGIPLVTGYPYSAVTKAVTGLVERIRVYPLNGSAEEARIRFHWPWRWLSLIESEREYST